MADTHCALPECDPEHSDLLAFARALLTAKDAEIAALKAERDALKQDAERYRWLRNGNDSQRYDAEKWMACIGAERLDAEIDAAMQAQGVQP